MSYGHEHRCESCKRTWDRCQCPKPQVYAQICDKCWRRYEEGDTKSYSRQLSDAGYDRKNLEDKLRGR